MAVKLRLLLLKRYEGGDIGAVNGLNTAVEGIQAFLKLDTMV